MTSLLQRANSVSPAKRAYLGFFCLIAALMVLSGQAQILWRLWRISAAAVSATGQVTLLDCPNHGHVDYSFDVSGVSHSGRNHFVDGINCPDIRIGQRVAVYYEAGAPENNFALYPPEAAGNRPRT